MNEAAPEPEVKILAGDEALKEKVIEALQGVQDADIPINIYDLGLIYELDIDARGRVTVHMSLTSPGSHLSYIMPARVKDAVRQVPGVTNCQVELVYDPPWTTERVSRRVRRKLDIPLKPKPEEDQDG